MPKVSVILPSYNYENYVSETIESVLAQSYQDWELVIVDDGSSDHCPEIIERYAKIYPDKIRVFYHEGRANRGIVETYQFGITQSLGEYIAFIESDDAWFPDNLEKKIAVLERDPEVAVAHSRVEMFGDEQTILKLKKKYNWPKFTTAGVGNSSFEAIRFLLYFNFTLTFSNFVTRKRFLEGLDFSPPRGAWLDWWLLSQLALRGRFHYVPSVCVKWRIHLRSQNFSYLSKVDDFFECFQMRNNLFKLVKMRFSERLSETPGSMRAATRKVLNSRDDASLFQMIDVAIKWALRKCLPPLWYEYLRNIFVNAQNRRIFAYLDDTNLIKGRVFRSDERPLQLVELYSGWEMLAGRDPHEPSPDLASKYPDILSASHCGFSIPLLPEWAKRSKILYLIAWQSGGRWKKIAEKRLVPPRDFIEKIKDLASFLLLIRKIHKRKVTIKPYRMAAPPLKILVSGLPKSGTTALYYQIKNSLHDTARCLFEPLVFNPEAHDAVRPVLAKILIAGISKPDEESFRRFDRKIWIVRDPRDRVVSSALYFVYHSKFTEDPSKRERYLELLREKEKDPSSVPFIRIIRLQMELNEVPADDAWLDFLTRRYRKGLEYHTKNPDIHVLRYEDFVEGRLNKLEEYLGFRLTGRPVVGEGEQRVVRTKSHGDWKNWFLKEDVEFFKPIFSEWMQHYGYADDWKTASEPYIDPSFGSKYVENLLMDEKKRLVENIAI